MRFSVLSLAAGLLGATTIVAQSSNQATCSLEQKCPEDAPCCSQYGNCGVGAYCLGGCDPRMSFSLDSCVPAPVCQDRKMKLDSTDSIVDMSRYLGDPDDADWVAQGEPVTRNGNVLLTMPRDSVGTVLASTVYMWYGTVKARMKSSRGRGVVTGFILLSDVKDEIDYEWVGVDLEATQTNYFFQGIPLHDQSENITLDDTFENFHEYEIRWTPDKITWVVDGEEGRVFERKDTWNETAQQWDFPQTPARVQLSVWPGGLPSNGQGTIDWAGGVIDWDHSDVRNAGYFYATVSDVEIECWDGDRGEIGSNDGRSYTYDNWLGTNDTVQLGDDNTVLKSLTGTGLNMDEDDSSSSGSGSSASSTGRNQIPGGVSPGGSHPGSDSNDNSDGGNGDGGSGGGGGGGGGSSNCNALEWNQNEDECGGNAEGQDNTTNAGSFGQERTTVGASAFAALVAVAALFWI